MPVPRPRVTGPSAPRPDPRRERSAEIGHHLVRQGNFLACFSRARGRAACIIGSQLGSRDTALQRVWLRSGTAGGVLTCEDAGARAGWEELLRCKKSKIISNIEIC